MTTGQRSALDSIRKHAQSILELVQIMEEDNAVRMATDDFADYVAGDAEEITKASETFYEE